jgi:membrane-associated phospholipid phosphatase
MLLVLPQRKRYGYALVVYAVSVAVATVYGRYHYAVDTFAGFAISLIAGMIGLLFINGYSRNTNR